MPVNKDGVFELRWGIMGCGGIAATFVKDLLLPVSPRGTTDVSHIIAAAGSSSSLTKAQDFLTKTCEVPASHNATAHSSYNSLLSDPNTDIIYIATPHSHHFQNCLLSLKANKNVLCEKPFTVNAAQSRILFDLAKEKGLFVMEAVWTRFQPLCIEIRDIIKAGKIGDVKRVISDLSFNNDVETQWSRDHRMVNLDLAGGALLDLGIYSLTWVFQILYHLHPPPPTSSQEPQVKAFGHIQKYSATGCDETTTILMNFPETNATGVAMTSLRIGTDPDSHATRIYGTLGEITVPHPNFRPLNYTITTRKSATSGPTSVTKNFTMPGGYGMYWQADECARCIRDGKQQSETMPWQETIAVMEVMDQVRSQGGLEYPEELETTKDLNKE